MFTGLVEDHGTLAARQARGTSARLRVRTALGPLSLGESVAVDGVCLTVDAVVTGGFEADASAETLGHTTLGELPVGRGVNLERALSLGGRLGGHLVSGHVDATTKLLGRTARGDALELAVALPSSVAALIAPKGSVTLNGVSLTVNEVGSDRFTVMVIPHTQGVTRLDRLAVGSTLNLEADLLARYVARFLSTASSSPAHSDASGETRWMDRLARAGFLSR